MEGAPGREARDDWSELSELKTLLDELEESFWVPLLKTPFSQLDKLLSASETDCPPLHNPLESFSVNLHAARELVEFPYLFITPFLPRVSTVIERIKLVRDEVGMPDVSSIDSKEDVRELVELILKGSKDHFSRHPEMKRLMHQSCLLIWSAFETFCKQVFILVLNQKPSLFGVIQKNQKLKERFAISQGSWPSLLEAHNYDLNGKLGSIIAADRDFSSPQLIMELFPAIFEGPYSSEMLESFKSDALWRLGQRRHLIAHRCGIVDRDYLNKVSDNEQEIGALLKLRGRDLAESMAIVAQCAIGLYGQARYCWASE